GRHWRRSRQLRPRAPREAFISGRDNWLATWSEQMTREGCRHPAPCDHSHVDDQNEKTGDEAATIFIHCGSPPVSLRNHRMPVCPKSTPSPNIIGQAPAISLMSC